MRPAIDPADIACHTLRDGSVEITVLSVGCAVQRWQVDGRAVVLGYADPPAYVGNPASLGVVIGRVANRIGGAHLVVDGQSHELNRNHGPHMIHGGSGGFGWRNWRMTPLSDRAVRLTLVSTDGDQGFPGTVQVQVDMTLEGHQLRYDMTARADRLTPLNLAQHQYFNLAGTGVVFDHSLTVRAARYTPTGADYRPTGQIAAVDGTAYDFRAARRVGDADPQRRGHDASFVLDGGNGPDAVLTAPDGLRLELTTNRPCLQLYTSGGLSEHAAPGPGAAHAPFHAVCLEAQDWPDAQAQGFPETLCGPGRDYLQRTVISIG